MITIGLEGDKAVIAKLQKMPSAVRQAMMVKFTALAIKLEAYIKNQKLAGQVLNRKTGALARSINHRVESSLNRIVAYVFSSGDVKYAAIQEHGGKTAPHLILPKKAATLAFYWKKIGKNVRMPKVNHPGSVMPERSYMRSSLRDMSSEISLGMKAAYVEGIMRSMK
jgi:phage gpG-like protein